MINSCPVALCAVVSSPVDNCTDTTRDDDDDEHGHICDLTLCVHWGLWAVQYINCKPVVCEVEWRSHKRAVKDISAEVNNT